MTRIRNLTQLQAALDKEFSWRLKEIADLKLAARQQAQLTEKTLIRAGVTLLYAHWEGFVKCAARDYLNFVSNQGRTYEELETCFVALGVKRHLSEFAQSKKSTVHVAALNFIRTAMSNRAEIQVRSAIDTESNLKAHVFEEIASAIGIETNAYESRFNLIDESLVARRNRIAHGEYLDIDAEGWRALADDVIALMRHFKTDIENAASLSRFLKVLPAPAATLSGLPN
jgi:MAE_28990/MAE_18760-like HEPN